MTVSVIVPWRASDARREASWKRVQHEWEGWDLFTGDDGGEPFSRGGSINLAVREHPADVYVIADADTLIGREQVETAVELAAYAPGLVVAFDRFAYLTEQGTQQVLDGHQGSWEPLLGFTLNDTVSSCIALSHDTWETAGGFDPRFRAWGYEDVQLEIVCATLANPTRRIPGTAWHLYHPPARERPTVNLSYLDEYARLRHDPDAMRAHVDAIRQPA